MTNTATRWRWIGFVGACFILGSLCWSFFSSVGGPSQTDSSNEDDPYVDTNIPKRELSPTEVVALQVQSIRDSVTAPERLTVCYSLASPQNREVTGPFATFAQMIMMPPYDRLATCQDWQMGTATIEEGYAAVLVSTASKEGDGTAFRFLLHQQDEAPYIGCWLTDAVQVLEQVRTPEETGKDN
jgi:hypothetical protein